MGEEAAEGRRDKDREMSRLLTGHALRHRTQEADLGLLLSLTWDILSLRSLWDVQGKMSSHKSPCDPCESIFQGGGGRGHAQRV